MKAIILFWLRKKPVLDRSQSLPRFQQLCQLGKQFGKQFITKIAHAREPQIWQSVDAQGNSWWCVYEPQTGHSYWFDSEDDVRVWLDTCRMI